MEYHCQKRADAVITSSRQYHPSAALKLVATRSPRRLYCPRAATSIQQAETAQGATMIAQGMMATHIVDHVHTHKTSPK